MELCPESVLREYMQQRKIRPHFKLTRRNTGYWECQVICGPYVTSGDHKIKDYARVIGIYRMLKEIEKTFIFTWIPDQEGEELNKEINRLNVLRVLRLLAHRVKQQETSWSEGHSLLFRDELESLLASQRIILNEKILVYKTQSLMYWELNTMPGIVRISKGVLRSKLRYTLLLAVVDSCIERLEPKGEW